MVIYIWDEGKNAKLKGERNIGFEAIVRAIHDGQIVDDFSHPNSKKYPLQRMMVVIIQAYAHLVPYIENEGIKILKTVIPSRKATKQYKKDIKKEAL